MRKLMIPAFVLASIATAHAGQCRGLVLAAADAPAQAQPAAAASQADAQPAPSQAQSAEAAPQQPSRPVTKSHARRRESDEAKARRIAARYGVTW
ncbi:hypothetical protein V5279_38380 [Bradyrhizobium sp. 26S5]|uniref:hypothetical protein n=1 Tax=Bradyrhizobium sp. 26S5 TaxID=3139729 RepID=UPI0030CE3862